MDPLVNPFGGELDRDQMNMAKELPVFIAHGQKDQSLKYELAVQSKDILSEQGYKVTCRSFDRWVTYHPPMKIMKEIENWIET